MHNSIRYDVMYESNRIKRGDVHHQMTEVDAASVACADGGQVAESYAVMTTCIVSQSVMLLSHNTRVRA